MRADLQGHESAPGTWTAPLGFAPPRSDSRSDSNRRGPGRAWRDQHQRSSQLRDGYERRQTAPERLKIGSGIVEALGHRRGTRAPLAVSADVSSPQASALVKGVLALPVQLAAPPVQYPWYY